MTPPSVSLILTINNRPESISEIVASSFTLPGNQTDQTVVVLDTPIPASEDAARHAYSTLSGGNVVFKKIDGPIAWKNPSVAWNVGFKAATGDLLYCISSDVVQRPHNVERAVELAGGMGSVVFGRAVDSMGETYCSSGLQRPLGFIMVIPWLAVERIGGYDETYMAGLCYEDHDFTFRLWDSGLDFVFDDKLFGVHIAHSKELLETVEGMAMKATNAVLAARKYGYAKRSTTFFHREPAVWWEEAKIRVERLNGTTIWRHP